MACRIAGIDVHKMLAVVIADVAVDGECGFVRRRVGTSPRELQELAAWLVAENVEEAVMESTAQYWRPVWRRWSATGSRRVEPARVPARCRGVAPGAGAVESRRARAQAGFPRRRTLGEAAGRPGTDAEFRAGCRAAPLADRDAPQVPSSRAVGCRSRTDWSVCWRKRI